MVALEERSIVRVAKAFGRDAGLLPEGTDIRAKADLVCHRDSISHAYTVKWRKAAMQSFTDANRQWIDRRAAIVWDAWRSLNDKLVERGRPERDMTVAIGWEHAAIVHHMLRMSVRPEFHAQIPAEESILEHLQKFRDDFLDLLVEKLDGRSQEDEQRALARRDELRRRWSKSD